MQKLFSRKETANLLGVSVRKVDSLCANGKLACIKQGRRTLYDVRDIDAYIEKNRRTSQTPHNNNEFIKEVCRSLLPVGIAAVAIAVVTSVYLRVIDF